MDLVPGVVSELNVDMLRSPRIILLLYMRSVIVNMMYSLLLIIRFIVARELHAVSQFKVFCRGIQLCEQNGLNAVDRAIGIMLLIALDLPSIV